jgi:hypothetical protein
VSVAATQQAAQHRASFSAGGMGTTTLKSLPKVAPARGKGLSIAAPTSKTADHKTIQITRIIEACAGICAPLNATFRHDTLKGVRVPIEGEF